VELREIAPGLHRWTAPHPEWQPGDDWGREVGCVSAETRDALVLVDPLVPDDGWEALDEVVARRGLPVDVLLTVAWHARSSEAVRERYPAWRGEGLPEGVDVRQIGTPAFAEGLVWLRGHRTLVSGDVLLGDGRGGVRLAPASWFEGNEEARRWYEERARDEIGALLQLPIERILVSHGEPVESGGRDVLAAALA
jgi:glyoxylase-like metal-dependent hydrolase (beta-lactamase superfamily II)